MVQMNLFVGQEYVVENGHVDIAVEGEGGTNWEIRIDMCKIDS